MFKIIRLNCNDTVADSLNISSANHSYETRSRNLLVTPFPRVNAVRISFKFQLLKLWSDLPESLKSCPTLRAFKSNLTSHLLQSY